MTVDRDIKRTERYGQRKIAAAIAAWFALGRYDDHAALTAEIDSAAADVSKNAWQTGLRSVRGEIEGLGGRFTRPAWGGTTSEIVITDPAEYVKRFAEVYAESADAAEALKAAEYIADRIAAAESVASYNEARREAVKDAFPEDRAVLRRWVTDGNPCEICVGMNGETIGLHDSYSIGSEPGQVHPRCQCSEEFIREAMVATLDLGIEDVHIPSAVKKMKTDEPKKLKPSQYADPKNREFPIHDKDSADKSAAQLEQLKSSMSPGKHSTLKSRIKSAQRKFGEKSKPMRGRGMRLSFDHPKHGKIEIRAMSDTDRLFSVDFDPSTALSDKPGSSAWNQLAQSGRYFKDGSFFELNDLVFTDIIRNFETESTGRIPVDFEHASELKGSDGSIPLVGAPAQGWITSLEKRDSQLWGLIEWGDLARDYIKGKNYRFLSPAIRFNQKDRHTGAPIGSRLTSAALTNIPFLTDMKPLAAKLADKPADDANAMTDAVNLSAQCYSTHEYMPKLRACLALSPLATPIECKEHLEKLRDNYTAAAGADTHQGIKLSDYMIPLRDLAQPAMGSNWDDVFDIVSDMIDTAIDEHVDEYHSGDAVSPVEMKETATEVVTESAVPESAVEDNNVDTKELETKVAELNVQLKNVGLENDKRALKETELTVQLKDATDKVAVLTAEIVTLKADADKRLEADLSAEVDAAVLAYKDTKGIKPEDKPRLLRLLKADAESFRGIYPTVDPAKAYLMRNVTTTEQPVVTTVTEVPDQNALILKFQKEGLSLEDAVSKAYAEANKSL